MKALTTRLGTFQESIDWLFAQVEADAALIPVFGSAISDAFTAIQAEVDSLFSSTPALATKKCVHKSNGGVGSIQPIVDEVFTALKAALANRPILIGLLGFVQTMVDAYIVANNL